MSGRLIVSLEGKQLSDKEKKIVCHPMTAGIILFTKNYEDKKQLKALIADIQSSARANGKAQTVPIFVDHEGGRVQRFGVGFKPLPAIEVLGKAYDINKESGLKLAKQYGYEMAKELVELGITSLAPVCDLNGGNAAITPSGRAFHADPDAVIALASAYIEGMHEAGMRATAKHFPGHGQNIGDTHHQQVADTRTQKEIETNDLRVFAALVKKGLIDAVMPSHIVYPAIDPEYTAGSSAIWLKDILRNKLEYQGVIVSDCLSMKGAGENDYDALLDKTKKALAFGDVGLMCHQTPETFLQILNDIQADPVCAATPEINARINKWVSRIEPKLKETEATKPMLSMLRQHMTFENAKWAAAFGLGAIAGMTALKLRD